MNGNARNLGSEHCASAAHTPRPASHNGGISSWRDDAAQEGITRGSEDGDRQAQQGAATDAGAVRNDIAELHGAARREVLARLQEDAQ